MRRALLLLILAACPAAEKRNADGTMPSEVLAKSDPNVDTSKHPVIKRYSGSYDDDKPPWSCQPSEQPTGSTSIGCGACLGCSSADAGSLSPLLAFAFVLRSRRRRRPLDDASVKR